MRKTLLAGATFVVVTQGAVAQDIAAGETSFRKCQPCHAIGESARSGLGPVLNGLDGRRAGTMANVAYSEGLKSSGITWGEETFKEYIKDPRGKFPDSTMFFPGIKDEKEISNLWAYLKQFGSDGKKK
jgi:cytochrome c